MVHGATAWLHTISAVVALLLGGFIFLSSKGTTAHKTFGYSYALAMLIATASAFGIYHLTGRLGPFHIAALVSFVTLMVALIPAMTRRPPGTWLQWHYKYMGWSYVGLLAATIAEAAVRIPRTPFWGTVAFGSAMVFACGGYAINRLRERTLAKLGNL